MVPHDLSLSPLSTNMPPLHVFTRARRHQSFRLGDHLYGLLVLISYVFNFSLIGKLWVKVCETFRKRVHFTPHKLSACRVDKHNLERFQEAFSSRQVWPEMTYIHAVLFLVPCNYFAVFTCLHLWPHRRLPGSSTRNKYTSTHTHPHTWTCTQARTHTWKVRRWKIKKSVGEGR